MRDFNNDEINISMLPQEELKLVKTNYGSMWIANQDKVIGSSLALTGQFEESKISEVVSFLKMRYGFSPSNFIDIGANIGTHLIYALKKIPFKYAVGIEPDPVNFSLLKSNIENNNLTHKCNIFNFAISDSAGETKLTLSQTNFGDHRIQSEIIDPSILDDEKDRKTINVKIDTFDNLIKKHSIDVNRNTLIWIDTQGHEGHVVSGITNIGETEQPFIVLEFWPYGIEKSGGKFNLMNFLKNCESVYNIRHFNIWGQPILMTEKDILKLYKEILSNPNIEDHPHTDFLCIPKKLKAIPLKKLNVEFLIFLFNNVFQKVKSKILNKIRYKISQLRKL